MGGGGCSAWLSAEITASPFQLPGDIMKLQRQGEEAQAWGPLGGLGRRAEKEDVNEKNIPRSR